MVPGAKGSGGEKNKRRFNSVLFTVLEEEWALGSLGVDLSRGVGAVECILEWHKYGCER